MAAATDYPIVVFIFSVLLAVVLIFNVYTAKLICDLNDMPGGSTNANAVCERRYSVDYGMARGPHTWSCEGESQSPINIVDKNVQKFSIRELLSWNHYDDLPISITVENVGHTIIVKANYSGNKPTISGADLLACYTFVQICFRWGHWNAEGSEHMINYRKFPLELQAMHRAGPQEDCISSYDLLMVAYFFEISAHNPYLDPLIQNLHRVKTPGSKINIAPFPLSYLCHQFRTGFYSYGGSITEPPCYQGAEWFVFPETFAISEQQINEFRQILSSDGKSRIVRNARPVQNSRPVVLNEYSPLDARSTAEFSMASEN